MKLKIITILIISIMMFTGCVNKNDIYEENDNLINNENITNNGEETLNQNPKLFYELSFEEKLKFLADEGLVLKDINTVKIEEFKLNHKYKYLPSLKDENNKTYVKISDTYIIEDTSEKEEEKVIIEREVLPKDNRRELLPSKIYATDVNKLYVYEYERQFYYIPVELCDKGEEKIIYQDYGIEFLEKDNKFKVDGKEIVLNTGTYWNNELKECIDGAWYVFDEEIKSIAEAYLKMWEIDYIFYQEAVNRGYTYYDEKNNSDELYSTISEYVKNRISSSFYKIYETDFDDELQTREIMFVSEIFRDWENTFYEATSLIYTNKKGELKECETTFGALNNVKNFKNVFFYQYLDSYLEEAIEEKIFMTYYLYDKEEGMILVEKLANGEDLTSEKFSEEFFTINGSYYDIYGEENGETMINICSMYNNSGIDESGNTFFDENNCLKDGTKFNIIEIMNHGNEIKIKTEDGRIYILFWSYT